MAPYDTLWGSQIEKAGSSLYRYKYVITNGTEETVGDIEVVIKDVPDATGITATLEDGWCNSECGLRTRGGCRLYMFGLLKKVVLYFRVQLSMVGL